ncbi:MAG: Rieske (2Fe-2S) protein [Chloroflexi bacterium]|nr:Rieske (2Fe-2S) protein [Chloroflexota bacterium]
MVIELSPHKRKYRLGKIDMIPEGEGRVFVVGQTQVAVFRSRSGEVYATQALCPHEGGQLADGIVGGRVLICPLHGYRFDLVTGQPIGQECQALTVYAVTLETEGDIMLRVGK